MDAIQLPSLSVGSSSSVPSLRWPSGKPLISTNLNRIKPEPTPSPEPSGSDVQLDSLAEVAQEAVAVPPQLEPVERFIRRFSFAESSAASSSAALEAVTQAGTSLAAPQLEPAALQLLLQLAALLAIPRSCNAPDADDLDAPALLEKDRFLQAVPTLLQLSLALARLLPPIPQSAPPPDAASVRRRAELVLAFGRFTNTDAPFHLTTSAATASELCEILLAPASALRHPIAHHILSTLFPPLFKPHPKLNPQTGRVLNRPLGGDGAMSEFYEEAEDGAGWRAQPGLAGVVKLVVAHIDRKEFEAEWHLVLPPLLTYLDDYSAPNKLAGTRILEVLLDKVEPSLLVRTGVGKVFEKSLAACFSSLDNPSGRSLFTAALTTSIALIALLYPLYTPPTASPDTPVSLALSSRTTTTPGTTTPSMAASLARLNALSALFANSILHTWQFHGGKQSLEVASCRGLPPLLDAFERDSGTIRFLQAIVPHLCALVEMEGLDVEGTVEMRLAAAEALVYVVKRARVRMGRWRVKVLGAVAKAWTGLREGEKPTSASEQEGIEQLEKLLKEIVVALREGEGAEEDVRRLVALDAELFGELCAE